MLLDTLYHKLQLGMKLSPSYHQWKFIELVCKQDFEPHGRASETWDFIWTLRLPHIRHYWKSTTGWRLTDIAVPMGFVGKTMESVIKQAIKFLDECPNPVELTADEYNSLKN